MKQLDGTLFRSMIVSGGIALEKHCVEVNDLNVFPVPDGDTGTNMTLTMQGGMKAMSELPFSSPLCEFAKAMKQGMLLAARGNSGVILSQFFSGLTDGLANLEVATPSEFAEAMLKGVSKAYEVVVKPVEGTILTVMREGCEYASKATTNLTSFEDYFVLLQQKMKESLQNTPELLPVLKEAGVIDSGGAGLVYIVEGMAQAIGGKIIADVTYDFSSPSSQPIDFNVYNENTKLDYGYCTEFILQLSNEKHGPESFSLEELIKYYESFGDSIVAFRDGNLVKTHVHTKTPDKAIAYALQFGDFLTFKMENMTLQHEETFLHRSIRIGQAVSPIATKKHEPVACVAVSPSVGISNQFKDFGVRVIIQSDYRMNPDIEEFIRAFDDANADNIIVLPNNKNELMVAHQAAKLYSKSWVYVLETSDVMKGMAAASIMDLADLSLDDNLTRMESAITKANSLSISIASKAYRQGNLRVHKGDYIGILNGQIVSSDAELVGVFVKTLQKVPEIESISLVRMFVNDDVTQADIKEMKQIIEDIDPFVEAVILEGGQQLYQVLATVE